MKLHTRKKLYEELKKLTDIRIHKHKIKYPIEQITLMIFFANLQGANDLEDIHTWMLCNIKNKYLLKIFKVKKVNIPSYSSLYRIYQNIDIFELEDIFREYFKEETQNQNISIDGKWLNGSDVNGVYTKQKHSAILNVLDKDKNITIAHKFMGFNLKKELNLYKNSYNGEKKSERKVFLVTLDENIYNNEIQQVFTFDALYSIGGVLNKLNEENKKYIAKIKGNSGKYKQEVINITNEAILKPNEFNIETLVEETTEHNTYVQRKIEVITSKSCSLLIYNEKYKNIQTIIKVTKHSDRNLKPIIYYYIANFIDQVSSFYKNIIEHWKIETYHYHLDKLTKEDNHIMYTNPFVMSRSIP